MTTRFSELKVDKIVSQPLQESTYIPGQRVSWLSYKDQNRLLVQSPDMITETYGIPREGPFHPSDKERAFYKLPFCHERHLHSDEIDYDQIEAFHDKLKEIDALCNSDEFRVKIFGEKNAAKYEYQPIVRSRRVENEEGDDEEEAVADRITVAGKTDQPYFPPYAKVKLDLAHNTGQPTFRLFDKTDGNRVEVKLDTFSDALKHMRFMTKHRFVIHLNRLYAMKNQPSSNEKRKYGIVLKLAAVECTNKTPAGGRGANPCVDLFDDDF